MTGYSGTPLAAKLGLRPGSRLVVVGAPPRWVGGVLTLPRGVRVGDLRARQADVVLLFCRRRADLAASLAKALRRIPPDGAIWVAWPKIASGVAGDLTENVVRSLALQHRLVDVKVAALDATWSGLKLVIPRRLREGLQSAPRGADREG